MSQKAESNRQSRFEALNRKKAGFDFRSASNYRPVESTVSEVPIAEPSPIASVKTPEISAVPSVEATSLQKPYLPEAFVTVGDENWGEDHEQRGILAGMRNIYNAKRESVYQFLEQHSGAAEEKTVKEFQRLVAEAEAAYQRAETLQNVQALLLEFTTAEGLKENGKLIVSDLTAPLRWLASLKDVDPRQFALSAKLAVTLAIGMIPMFSQVACNVVITEPEPGISETTTEVPDPTQETLDPEPTAAAEAEPTNTAEAPPTRIPAGFMGLDSLGLSNEEINAVVTQAIDAGLPNLVSSESTITFKTPTVAYFGPGNYGEATYGEGDAIVLHDGTYTIFSRLGLGADQTPVPLGPSYYLATTGDVPVTAYTPEETPLFWVAPGMESYRYNYTTDEFEEVAVTAEAEPTAETPEQTEPTPVEWSWESGEEMPDMHTNNSSYVDNGDGTGFIQVTTETGEIRVPIAAPEELVTRDGQILAKEDAEVSVNIFSEQTNARLDQKQPDVEIFDKEGNVVCYFNIETGVYQPKYETVYLTEKPIVEGVPGTWADDFGVEEVREGSEQEGVARYITLTGQVTRVYMEYVPANFSSSPPPSFIKPEGDYANVTWAVVQVGDGTEIDILVTGNDNYTTNIMGAPQGITITNDGSRSPGRNIIPESTVSNLSISNALSNSIFVEVQLRDWKEVPQNGVGLALQYPEWYYSKMTIARDDYIRSMGDNLHDVHYMQKDVLNQIVNGEVVSEQHVPFSYSILTIVTDSN